MPIDHPLHALRPSHRPAVSVGRVAMGLLACLLAAGCTLRPPFSGETHQVDSVTLPDPLTGGASAPPFCLHLRYHNAFFGLASDTRVEAWTTAGRCDSDGGKQAVHTLQLNWWLDWHDRRESRQCIETDHCGNNQQDIVTAHHVRCAWASALLGNQLAFVSTDEVQCH